MEVRLKIADFLLQVEADVNLVFLKRDWFSKFAASGNAGADIAVYYHAVDERLAAANPPSAEEERLIRASRHIGTESALLGAVEVRQRLSECMQRPELAAIELHPHSITFYDFFARRLDVYFFSMDGEDLSRRNIPAGIMAPFLPAFSAAVLHSSAIVRNGRAALFLAPDEGGKTTVVRSAKQGVILSDDQNVLRKENGSVMVHGTPWGMLTSPGERAPLGGLFFLEQAAGFGLQALTNVAAFESLYREHRLYAEYLPGIYRAGLFDLLYDVCRQTPCYRMSFERDFVDWEAIDAALR